MNRPEIPTPVLITRHKNRLLDALNKDTMDPVPPVGGSEEEMKVLREMSELQDFENDNWSKRAV